MRPNAFLLLIYHQEVKNGMTPLGPKDVISGFNEFDIATIFRWKSIASINKFPPTQIFTKWKAPSLQFLLHYTFVSPKALPATSFITISFLLKPGGQTHLCNGKRLCCLQKLIIWIFFLQYFFTKWNFTFITYTQIHLSWRSSEINPILLPRKPEHRKHHLKDMQYSRVWKQLHQFSCLIQYSWYLY